jgi:hypothetical protein
MLLRRPLHLAMARATSSLTAELNARVASEGIVVRGPVTAEHAEILTVPALRFLAKLHRYRHALRPRPTRGAAAGAG